MPQVSVVIPTQGRHSLRRAVASVLAQTEADFEVIIVDDHSASDQVVALVREHNDRRLRSVRVSGRGGAATARNIGIRCAAADYIAFLDDDDEWLPGKLAAQLGVMVRCAASIGGVYTARLTINSLSGRTTTERFQARFQPGVTDNVITTSSLLVRRRCFERVEEMFERAIESVHRWAVLQG